jgi:hypothetical protein
MQSTRQKSRLRRTLVILAKQAQSKDLKLLKEMEKCPSSKAACALLAGALNACRYDGDRNEFLSPDASWIHPLV